jgi:hypothetical protein
MALNHAFDTLAEFHLSSTNNAAVTMLKGKRNGREVQILITADKASMSILDSMTNPVWSEYKESDKP